MKAPYQLLADNIGQALKGQTKTIRLLLAAFFTGGHVLLEDFPGTGKTTLAKALARSIDADFQRVQFTPDLMPSDILGLSIFNPKHQSFEVHKGPIFCEILLADEINRASPRTQSALLEAMGEAQVSLEGKRYGLPELFFVIATQNPVEFHGTYPLPEAQMDRFALRLSLGYLSQQDEVAIISEQVLEPPLAKLQQVTDKQALLDSRDEIASIPVSNEIKNYIVNLVAATRTAPNVDLGASPRASITLIRAAQALAYFDSLDNGHSNGAGFVTPDHIQELAVPALSHRIVLNANSRFGGNDTRALVDDLLKEIPVPR